MWVNVIRRVRMWHLQLKYRCSCQRGRLVLKIKFEIDGCEVAQHQQQQEALWVWTYFEQHIL